MNDRPVSEGSLIAPPPQAPCTCGATSAPLGELCPATDPDDPGFHSFHEQDAAA